MELAKKKINASSICIQNRFELEIKYIDFALINISNKII